MLRRLYLVLLMLFMSLPAFSFGRDDKSAVTIYEKINPAIVAIDAELEDGVSAGTGCIVSSDGIILTGSHVIEGCKSVDVTMYNGKVYKAEILSKMGKNKDLALLKIKPEQPLHTIKFGDEVGHVLAQGLAGRLLLLPNTAVQADGYLRTEVSFFFRHGDSPFLDGKASISKALWNSYSQKATKKLCKRKRNGQAPPQNFWWPSAGRSGIIRVSF